MTLTVINKNFSRTFRVYCSHCKLICGVVWFVAIPEEDKQRNLCFQCYEELEKEDAVAFTKIDILKKMESNKESKLPTNKSTWNIE